MRTKYRMECIGNVKGVTYYNDTIANIPEATISAIESLKIVDTLIFEGRRCHRGRIKRTGRIL